jgi:hypothetical protein
MIKLRVFVGSVQKEFENERVGITGNGILACPCEREMQNEQIVCSRPRAGVNAL